MRVNLFEGTRRIAFLVAGIWAVGVLFVVWSDEPTVDLAYIVTWPGNPPVRATEEGCEEHDVKERDYAKTQKGTSVKLSFCFKGHEANDGEILVPYRVDAKTQMWWGATEYSSEISSYKARVVSQFLIPKVDSDWVDGQRWTARAKQLWEGARWLFGGWFFILFFSGVTGWIVRGFLGIPMGQDEKPVNKQEE